MLTYVRIGNLYKPYKLPIRMAIRIANSYGHTDCQSICTSTFFDTGLFFIRITNFF